MKVHKPTVVWMYQIGFGVRYDRIKCFYFNCHCISLFLPGVSIVFSYNL